MEDDTDDLIDQFFSSTSSFKKFEAPKPLNEYCRKSPKREREIEYKREETGVDYAKKVKLREENLLATQTLNQLASTSVNVSDNEDSDEEFNLKKEDHPEWPEINVYERYPFDVVPQNLPILSRRDEILKTIRESNVMVLTASTGTGKSSQVPQYILEESKKKNKNCNIIIAQPRRIAGYFAL